MDKLPAPLTPPECDLRGMPFPHDLLIKLSAETFGMSEVEATDVAKSLGWIRVSDGWVMGH